MVLKRHLTKVFERVLSNVLVRHLELGGHLPDSLHGFCAQSSCLTQLLAYWDIILEQMEQGLGVDAVYTDKAKAVDKCDIGVLLHKLKECRARGKVGCWLATFLDSSVRKQAIGVDGRLSTLSPVNSGVHQGTVLGPILFHIHIEDMGKDVSPDTSISNFVDDT